MRWTALAAAIMAAVVDVLYLGIVGSQGQEPQFLRVPFVAVFIAVMAISAVLAPRPSSEAFRPFLLGLSSGGLLLLGYFAIFSIGLPLIIAGVLALFALIRSSSVRVQRASLPAPALAAAGGILSVAILFAGFALSEVVIKCPPTGTMGGGGASLLGGSYEYNCVDGKLTITR
jgi:hypothetical protein